MARQERLHQEDGIYCAAHHRRQVNSTLGEHRHFHILSTQSELQKMRQLPKFPHMDIVFKSIALASIFSISSAIVAVDLASPSPAFGHDCKAIAKDLEQRSIPFQVSPNPPRYLEYVDQEMSRPIEITVLCTKDLKLFGLLYFLPMASDFRTDYTILSSRISKKLGQPKKTTNSNWLLDERLTSQIYENQEGITTQWETPEVCAALFLRNVRKNWTYSIQYIDINTPNNPCRRR